MQDNSRIEWLKENYATASWEEMRRIFPELSDQRIRTKANSLGAKRTGGGAPSLFSAEDDEWLKLNYGTAPWEEVLANVRGFTKNQIISHCHKVLNVQRKDYEEYNRTKNIIIEHYSEYTSTKKLIKDFGLECTEVALRAMAGRLGVKRKQEWTEEEDRIIFENYSCMKRFELMKLLPGRSITEVYNHLKKLGLEGGGPGYKYTESDYKFIKENYMIMTDSEMGEILHREAQSIKELRRKLKLYRRNPDDPSVYKKFEDFLINEEKKWKRNSMDFDNTFLCFLSEDKFDNIHHLYSRNLLIKDMISELEIDIDDFDINQCSKEERNKIISNYQRQEEKHPFGICLRRDIHLKFHNIYGYGNNTPEQFVEFVEKFFPDKLDKIKEHIQQNYNI